MRLQLLERDRAERGLVRRLEYDSRSVAGFHRFFPAKHAQAPTISRVQTRKSKLGPSRREVVPAALREREKVGRHHRTHEVSPDVGVTAAAAPIAVKPGQWIVRAVGQAAAEHVPSGGRRHESESRHERQSPRGETNRNRKERWPSVPRLPGRDLNPDCLDQNQVCYRYTTG